MAKSFNARMKDRFTKITNDYQKVNEYVHETAMMIAKHAMEHGDCSTAQGLVMAMPASIRREMLILWFGMFTPIVVKNSDAFESKMHKPESKLFIEWDIEGADAKPFYELAKDNKEAEPKDLEALIAMIHGLGIRIEKMIEKGEVKSDDIASAEVMADRVKKLRFTHVEASPAANNDEQPAASNTDPVANAA